MIRFGKYRQPGLFLLPILCLLFAGCGSSPRYYRFDGFAQGGTWHVICELPAGRAKDVRHLRDGIDSILLEIDGSVSGYNRGSLLSRFNAGEIIVPDHHFLTLFELSKELSVRTEGAFDPSAAPLFDLWGFGFAREGDIPSRSRIDSVLHFVGMNHFSLSENGEIIRDDPRCRLNFNAIAQGYSCDAIARYLKGRGCCNFLVEVGGEIVCSGHRADGEPWKIVCDAPLAANDTLRLTDCAIVTSGNYRKNGGEGGRRFGHIIDPRSGTAMSDISASRTIIVGNDESEWPGATADALATAEMVKNSF